MMSSKVTAFEWINNLGESNLGLNSKVKKKFEEIDSIEDIGEYVDLGLPSGIQWRKYNIGSYSDNETGDFFNYREVKDFSNKNNKVVVPSRENFRELKKYCEIQELPDGLKYTSKINQKSIMFKYTGYVQNDEFHLDPARPCGIWWSSSKNRQKSMNIISLRPSNERPRKWGDPEPRVFSVFEANGYDYDANKFCIRPILLPDFLATNEPSLGLSKKVTNKYKNKTTDDVIDDMLDEATFKKELIAFVETSLMKRMCKVSVKTTEFPERTEICFDFGKSEQVYFIFAKEGCQEKNLEGHFGIMLNDSEEGESFATYLNNPPCSEDCEVVSEDSHNFHMLRVMYRVSPHSLKASKEFLINCAKLTAWNLHLCPYK